MELSVRRAEERDIPAILGLLIQVDMVHHNGRPDIFKGPATKYDPGQLSEIISNDKTPVFVCVDEDDKVLAHGFCIHRQIIDDPVLTDIRTLYIDDICVDSKARGRHVGRTLFEYIKSYAREQGYYNITLNVWSCNPGAYAFYETMGLVPQKTGMELIL